MKSQSIIIALLAIALNPLGSLATSNRIVEGEVELRREGWSRFRKVSIGTVVNYGDVLRAVNGVTASIRCAGSRPSRVPGGGIYPVSYFCGNPNQRLIGLRSGGDGEGVSEEENPQIPYLISPRRTSVQESSVTLRWNPLTDVTRYSVRLTGGALVWEKVVTDTEVVYDGEIPLEPGEVYTVVIKADNQTSSESDLGSEFASFELLFPFEVEQLEAEIEELNQQDLSETVRTLTLADIYLKHKLVSDAIATLESLVSQDSEIAVVYQELGELYHYIGLNSRAQERYEQAIALAITNRDLEVQTIAEADLGRIMVKLNDSDSAIELFSRAIIGYRLLGDLEQVETLRELIQSLRL